MGLYQVALSLFSLFITLGSGGIPLTVSRMIAKSKAEKDVRGELSTLSAGLTASLLISLPCCVLLWLFGEKMTFLFSDIRAFSVLRILLIGLCCSSVYSVIRGYFWGNKKFFTASVLEMTEETVMVIAGVLLLRGVPSPTVGAERAAWAVVLSYLFSAVVALVCFFAFGGKLISPKKALKPLFNASLPITFVRASASLVNSAVAVLFPAVLIKNGMPSQEAVKLFGIISGMVMPVLFIPSTLIGSLALVLVPELSEDYYQQNLERLKRNIQRGLRFAFIVACALLPFFFVLGEGIGSLAFSNAEAGRIISKSCVVLLPMSLTMISTSMLNSIGFEKQTFIFYFVGAGTLLLCILFLPAVCGVYAYVAGLGASYAVTAVCNLVFLYKKCPILKGRRWQVCVELIFPALICALPVSIAGQLCLEVFLKYTGQVLSIIFTGAAMGIFTLVLYLLTRILDGRKKIFFKKRAIQ